MTKDRTIHGGGLRAMRRTMAILGVALIGGCLGTEPFAINWRYAAGDGKFELIERCYGDDAIFAAKEDSTEGKGTISRRRAEALQRLIEKVDAGQVPTERDYRKAGC